MHIRDLAFFPDDYPREDLAKKLRQPRDEIPIGVLQLAADILEGKVPFKPSKKIQQTKNIKTRDKHIVQNMAWFVALGLPAFQFDRDGNDLNKRIDAAYMVERLLVWNPGLCSGRKALKRDEIRKIYARSEAVRKEGDGYWVKGLAVTDKFKLGRKMKEFNNGQSPQTENECFELFERWNVSVEKGEQSGGDSS